MEKTKGIRKGTIAVQITLVPFLFNRRMSSNKKETNWINSNRYECIEGEAAHIENRFGITAGDVSKQDSGRSASIKLLMSPTVFLYVPTIYSLRSSSSSSSSVRYTVCRLSLLVSTVSSFPRELSFVYTDHSFSIYGNRAGRKKGSVYIQRLCVGFPWRLPAVFFRVHV
jgi:hypothetical protein